MGSGLVLLVIVGAWLAVLVPMFLRSHDAASAVHSMDRFNDAMRVLSRRQGPDRRSVVMPRRAAAPGGPAAPGAPGAPGARARVAPGARVAGPSLAVRRRRVLLGLLAAALVLLVGWGLAGGALLLLFQLLADALAVSFVLHCRRQARLRGLRRAAVPLPSPRPERGARPRRAPARPRTVTPAARYEDPMPSQRSASPEIPHLPARAVPAAALGEPWSPVPVPVPTYVGAPVAPSRLVLDLTRPGEWSAAVHGDDEGLELLDDGPELDDILSRRRAVND